MEKCAWCKINKRMEDYHDSEWGVPLFDDDKQFEFISLEVMQCGLNWNMMLAKREVFKDCFDGFCYKKVALYGEDDVARILNTEGMIKSEKKIRAVINNAKATEKIVEECGSFSAFLWGLADNKIHVYGSHLKGDLPAKNELSEKVSGILKKKGFKFMGPVVVYSHLQACGIINDHNDSCFRFAEVMKRFDILRHP